MFAQPGRGCSFCGRDLWDVVHYVSVGPIVICDICVTAASAAIAGASVGGSRELFLPPRVFGDGGGEQDATEIAEAFRAVFTSDSTAESRGQYIDGSDEVKQMLTDAHARLPGATAASRVERIRFLDGETAEVRFQINLGPHPMGPVIDGRAVRKQGRWLVASDTVIRVATLGGAGPPFGRTLNI